MTVSWHNNHHHYRLSVRQGFFWWQVDVTYYLLVGLKHMGFAWDLRPVPVRALRRDLIVNSSRNLGDE